ncbi:MAG: carboxypeptidase regulatory-like domain-containing protein [Acidobacteriota bacterium]
MRTVKKVKYSFLGLMVFLAISFAGTGWGQEFRGSISGRILDATGALVPGVTVVATNEETNVSVQALSNEEGNYTIPYLLPGSYTISTDIPGFKKSVRKGIVVQVRDKLVIDFQIEVGEVTETVTVAAATPLLRVGDANLGQVVDRHFLDKLPLAGLSPLGLADMSPGVVGGGGGVTSNSQNDIAIGGGGGQDRGNDVTVDGIPNVAPRQRGLAVTIPMVDAVQEFRVQTTLFDASNGRSNGGVLAVSTRGGTNQFRGTAYGFLRNRALDANSWTNNKLGLEKPPIHYNAWGGTIGGPVRLPLYNGQDRTFFFFGFEKTSNARSITRQARVPTERERQGDFSQTLPAKGSKPFQIFDPYTTVLNSKGSFVSRDAFPGTKIPANMLSPIGVAVLEQLPLPNLGVAPQINKANWGASSTQSVETENWVARVDHNISSRQRLYARFGAVSHDSIVDPIFFPGAFSIPPEGTTDLNFDLRRNKSFALDDTFTFSPTFVSSFRYGYTRTFIDVVGDGDSRDPKLLKLPDIILQNQTGGGFPIFNLGENVPQIGSRTRLSVNDIHAFFANMNKLTGNHTLNFGVDYRLVRWNESNPNTYAVGQFQFNNTFTRANPQDSKTADWSGSGMASLLLGLPTTSNGSRIGFDSPLSLQTHYAGLFIQDDFKVRPNLTLNLGLRYEVETPYTERFDRLAYGFDPDAKLPISVPGFEDLRGGYTFVNQGPYGRRMGTVDTNNWGPRFGFAYSPDSRTVIRGGFGIFFSSAIVNQYNGVPRTSPSFGAITNYVGSSNKDRTPLPGVNLSNPFPAGVNKPTGNSEGLMTQIGGQVRFADPNRVLPYTEQWQFGIQRELPWQSMIEVSYAGNHMLKGMEHGLNYNETPDEFRRNTESVPNPFYGVLPATSTIGASSSIQSNRLNRRFPQFDSVTVDSANSGRSIYHSLQTRFQKRTSDGFTFVGAYTFSKIILYQMTTLVNQRAYQRYVPDVDFPHILRLFATYELPWGQRGSFGRVPVLLDQVLGHALGGWSVTWTTAYTSGNPLTFEDPDRDRPIPIRDPRTAGSVEQRLGDRVDADGNILNPFLDPAAFERLADEYAITPEPEFYGWLRGPAPIEHSLTLFKNFNLYERWRLEFRGEIRNPFNSPQWEDPITDISSSDFGAIKEAEGQRTIMIGAKLRF